MSLVVVCGLQSVICGLWHVVDGRWSSVYGFLFRYCLDPS